MARRGKRSFSKHFRGGTLQKQSQAKVLHPEPTSLFPGASYQVHLRASPLHGGDLEAMEDTARRLAVALGPDHPRVKMLRKEIADRSARME